MSVGTISEVLRIEWNLPNFWNIDVSASIKSPPFTSLGCSWELQLYDDLFSDSKSFKIYLGRIRWNADFNPHHVIAILGIRLSDGTFEECVCSDHPRTHFILKKDDLWDRNSLLLPSGTLTVTCRFDSGTPTAEKVEPNPSAIEIRQMKLVELEDLSSDFRDLLSSERKCDVTVNVQGKEFRVHRAVLSARSSVFRAMYEHETSEDKTGYLTIPDCDPESFGDFLNYIYSGKLDEISFSTAYNLYATAEKYDVQKLKSFCACHVKGKMTMENVSDVIILADKFGDDALKSSCADYARRNLTVDSVCQAILLADRYGDDELMSSAREFFNKNFSKIFLTSEWKAMLRNNFRLVDMLLSGLDEAASKKP